MLFKRELIDELVSGRDAKEIFERNGLLDKLKEALAERLSQSPPGRGVESNVTRLRSVRASTPSSGADMFDREDAADDLPSRYRVRFPGFEEEVAALFARGFGVRDIQRRLEGLYGATIPAEVIAAHADAVVDEALEWQSRALEPVYPIVVFDSVRVKVNNGNGGRNKSCYFALGIHPTGAKEILGLWPADLADGSIWTTVIGDLKRRGVEDVLIFVNGFAGFREAASGQFPHSLALTCIVEVLRDALQFASSQGRAAVAGALREIYCAHDGAAGFAELQAFAAGPVAAKYPTIAPLWTRAWSELAPFFALPVEIRRIIASTFAMDMLQRTLKRAIRLRGQMASDEDAVALIYLVMRNGQKNWKRPQREWHAAKTQFAIVFADRFNAR